jgi:hypothetical protein
LDLCIEFNGEIEPVAHERNVSHDGFPGNFQEMHELRAIGQCTPPKFIVDLQHSLERRTRKLETGIHDYVRGI